MHAYDVSRRPHRPSAASARPVQDPQGGPSATPIYDSLYAEYVKTFRSLPGDRSGEEELGFTAFGAVPHSTGGFSIPAPASYSAYSAGASSARHGAGPAGHQWHRVGQLSQLGDQPTGMHHVPAALPPAPRRGF
ncbi:hypothetical protein [Streptomyces sp. NPDC057877]|uniref:hypothetical protein n=1 Tax=Streptomyces sp. NPDC057877 TaxID=3346269 RepID=UPI003696FD7B